MIIGTLMKVAQKKLSKKTNQNIVSLNVKGNYENNTALVTATADNKKSFEEKKLLSEVSDMTDMFISKVKGKLKFDKIFGFEVTIDFNNKIIDVELYIELDNEKINKQFTEKF